MSHNHKENQQSRWNQLEALLGTKLPALPSEQEMAQWQDTSWVEEYVQQMLHKTIPRNRIAQTLGLKQSLEVFETHHYVIVKLKLPEPNNPIVLVRADRITIEDLPKLPKKTVRLPSLVLPYQSKASHKDGILQLKLRKRKINPSFHEVPVRYM